MREILFRGKRLQGGNWVEGYFFKSDINKEERESGKATLIFTPDCDTFIMVPECHDSFMVVSDTVGQYTGLRDKNGKRIFEGDLLSLRTGRPHVVRFEDGAFVFENTAIPMRFANKLEVIGNVHDNPELLEVSGNAYAAI